MTSSEQQTQSCITPIYNDYTKYKLLYVIYQTQVSALLMVSKYQQAC